MNGKESHLHLWQGPSLLPLPCQCCVLWVVFLVSRPFAHALLYTDNISKGPTNFVKHVCRRVGAISFAMHEFGYLHLVILWLAINYTIINTYYPIQHI